ncbi:divisome protein SepX/GlpR [Kitasatospora sp. LaBMicrA B282]|uniref:divisome protein SepX/GlpR n=1 Tax=Kitasatospora sp. LaBMicrA B282 TaxID=3420949 RepID=UPI003D0CF3F6
MSSSGLIYAVIVGAWAAYLVPMWLRRQDELNEARPTERFSTAIRLLAGRSALERRASRVLADDDSHAPDSDVSGPDQCGPGASGTGAGFGTARTGADRTGLDLDGGPDAASGDVPAPVPAPTPAVAPAPAGQPSGMPVGGPGADRRARLLARRRRMVTLLFLAFALGAIVAAVAGVTFLWAPALPAVLLTLYIRHLRRLERQRYEVKLDRVRAAQAAQRLREREQVRSAVTVAVAAADAAAGSVAPAPTADRTQPRAAGQELVEATDHQEWVDGLRERAAAGPDSWEPVPVPLPTYVTAPVAPRITRGLDLAAPGTWTSGRPAEPPHTPLFDQYETPPVDRPRAVGE